MKRTQPMAFMVVYVANDICKKVTVENITCSGLSLIFVRFVMEMVMMIV